MTDTVQARCQNCAAELAAVGAPCVRCAGGPPAAFPSEPFPQGPYATPQPEGPLGGGRHSAPPFGGPSGAPGFAAPPANPYGTGPYGPPFAGQPYVGAPYPGPSYQPPFTGPSYPGGPQHYGVPLAGVVGAPRKEVAVAIVLSFLWIGAGHFYLGRVGMGAALMAAHFVLGLFFLVLFAPLGFLLWVGALVWCCVWCSNLTAAINAGTAPPTATW